MALVRIAPCPYVALSNEGNVASPGQKVIDKAVVPAPG